MTNSKINRGDLFQVISPSDSFKPISGIKEKAQKYFETKLKLKIKYSKNCYNLNKIGSSTVDDRVEDIHTSFLDKEVKVIVCSTGGYNSNDLLDFIDWDVIRKNPKPFVGSSDITVLLNAIYAKTGNITFYGPNFYKFGMEEDSEYMFESFRLAIMETGSYKMSQSTHWSCDKWYRNQDDRKFIKNTGPIVINEGVAKGTIVGGNLCSLNLLQGTDYMPSLKNAILFIEDDDLAGEHTFGEFRRNLQSLLQTSSASEIKAIVIGRFMPNSKMDKQKIELLFSDKNELKNIPIVANIDFGHTDPIATFPIGGTMNVEANSKKVKIVFAN